MTVLEIQKKWVGKMVASSTDHGLDVSGRHPRKVEKIYLEAETGDYLAYAGEHHRANTPEALDRRLHQLASRL